MVLKNPWVSLESDAEVIVRNCNNSKDPPVDVSDPHPRLCLVLKESFIFCDASFVKRDCNH